MKALVVAWLILLCMPMVPLRVAAQERVARRSTPLAHGNANAITAARLRTYLSFIASDETAGRATPSRGLDSAAHFIAAHLARLGLRSPGGDGSWFQHIPLRRNRIDSSATWIDVGGRRFRFGEDFIVNVFPGTFAGPIVYVSHGWVIKAKNVDPYVGLDVRDKIVVVAETGLPSGVSRADLRGPQGDGWEPPQPALRRRGAKAMLMIPSSVSLLQWQSRARDGTEVGITSVEGNLVTPPIPVIRPSLAMFQALLDNEQAPASLLFNRAASGDPAPPFVSHHVRAQLFVDTNVLAFA